MRNVKFEVDEGENYNHCDCPCIIRSIHGTVRVRTALTVFMV